MARSMLKSKKLPKEFWAEAVAWGKTPQETWSGRKLGIFHLRVFESIAHVHVSNERRTKLDDKSERFIFIGYDSSSKGYKLYNPKQQEDGNQLRCGVWRRMTMGLWDSWKGIQIFSSNWRRKDTSTCSARAHPININHSWRHFVISWEWNGYVTHKNPLRSLWSNWEIG